MNIKALLASVAILAVAAPAAHADTVIIFDSYSSSAHAGNSGTDAQGNPWSWVVTLSNKGVWGAPGLGAGLNTFNTTTGYAASDFSVSFVNFGAAIDTTASPDAGGYNEYTRFTSDIGGTLYAWTPVYDGTRNVTFNAPSAAAYLHNGDTYFVNVAFTTKVSGSDTGFTAGFSTAVPETSTWIMMLAGFAGLGLAGYRRRALAA
jgi:hypothetical protein